MHHLTANTQTKILLSLHLIFPHRFPPQQLARPSIQHQGDLFLSSLSFTFHPSISCKYFKFKLIFELNQVPIIHCRSVAIISRLASQIQLSFLQIQLPHPCQRAPPNRQIPAPSYSSCNHYIIIIIQATWHDLGHLTTTSIYLIACPFP